LRSGDIKITSKNPKFKFANFISRIYQKNPYKSYNINKGSSKEIIFNGARATLTITVHRIRVVSIPKDNTLRVINRYGTVRGYMPNSGLRIINRWHNLYSRTAGIYRHPSTYYRGWSTRVTSYTSYRYTPPQTFHGL